VSRSRPRPLFDTEPTSNVKTLDRSFRNPPPAARELKQQPREPPFGNKGETEKLNEIFRVDHLQSNRIGDPFFARAKHQVSDEQDDAVIAVMFLTQCRVMSAMEIRRDDDAGQPFLARNDRFEVSLISARPCYFEAFASLHLNKDDFVSRSGLERSRIT
jgi:hypothetical protein